MSELEVDPKRISWPSTGIFVRAKEKGSWVSTDIATLTYESLVQWLREKQEKNPEYAIQCVVIILGHANKEKGW